MQRFLYTGSSHGRQRLPLLQDQKGVWALESSSAPNMLSVIMEALNMKMNLEVCNTTALGITSRPYYLGKLEGAASPPSFFFLCETVSVSRSLSDAKELGARLADIHKRSQLPTHQFGFYIITYNGGLPEITI